MIIFTSKNCELKTQLIKDLEIGITVPILPFRNETESDFKSWLFDHL